MKRLYHTIICYTIWLLCLTTWWYTYAADIASFRVEVASDIAASEPVDVTVTALDKDWNIVKDAQSTLFFELVEDGTTSKLVNSDERTNPAPSTYDFVISDQWVKTFSKLFTIKKEGIFKLVVTDLLDDTIKWEKRITVGKARSTTLGSVVITSPIPNGTEKWSSLSVIGSSSSFPNTPIQVLINDKVSTTVINQKTDSRWWFTVSVWDIQPNKNSLQVKLLNVSDEVVAESDIIEFIYTPLWNGAIKQLSIDPSWTVKQWQQVTVNVKTDDNVSSVQLKLSADALFPMDKIKDGEFKKTILLEDVGTYNISADIMSNGNQSTITDLGTLQVEPGMWVSQIKLVRDNQDKKKLTVSRKLLWNPSSVIVLYGIDKNNLNLSWTTTGNNIVINWLDPEKTYYLQVITRDTANNNGTPSEIISFEPTHNSAWSCRIEWIPYRTEKMWDKYYIVRDLIPDVIEYSIFKTDITKWSVDIGQLSSSDFQKIWTTTDGRFEYPFDNLATQDQYAYFAIQATCSLDNKIDTSQVKKIKVWPIEDIALIGSIALIWYLLYSLYGIQKRTKHI